MQLLMLLMSVTFANSFSYNLDMHSQAVNRVRNRVKIVADAQEELKKSMESCSAKNIDGQKTLLGCAQQFVILGVRFSRLLKEQTAARELVMSLPEDFAQSKIALNKVLDKSDTMLSNIAGKPKELSKKYFELNANYVSKQFEAAQINATAKARTTRYCRDLQFQIQSVSQSASLMMMQTTDFEDLYKISQRMKNIAVTATVVSDVCQQKYDLSTLNSTIGKIEEFVSPGSFRKYQGRVCSQLKLKSLSKEDCLKLSLNPYSVEQLLIASGSK